jgi:aminopeptidase N
MADAESPGLRILAFRAYAAIASSAASRNRLKQLLSGEHSIAGVTLSSNDRFRIIRRLLIVRDPDADAWLVRQSALDTSDEGRRFAYATRAASADVEVKRRLFSDYLTDAQLPERWIEDSLAPFNAVEHERTTIAWLASALDALPELKRRHKIFFVNDWLAAFVGGQRSSEALAITRRKLEEGTLPQDLQRKLLEVIDDLERTVQIRARYAISDSRG